MPTEQKKATLKGSVKPNENQNSKNPFENQNGKNSWHSLPTSNEPQRHDYLNPQRYWEKDTTLPPPPQYNNNNNYNCDRNQTGNYNVIGQQPSYPLHQRNQQSNQRSDPSARPKHISENTRHVSTVGPDGSTMQITTSSTRHDGQEVYSRTEENIRVQRLKQLKDNGNIGKLQGSSQRPQSLKLYITRVNPEATAQDMEVFLLETFPILEKVIVRQQPMHHSRYYQSFVIIVISKKPLNIGDFEHYQWPDDIKCFPGIPNNDRNV